MLHDSKSILFRIIRKLRKLIMAISANKKFWTEFIDIYHNLPSLWNTKDENYNNRESRSLAWNKLVEKLQEVEPEANQDSVKRKINTFRSNFNREVRKIRLARKEVSAEIYNPTLWYFDQLSFLLNQEKYNSNGAPIDEEITLMGLTTAKTEMIENETIDAESDITENDKNSHQAGSCHTILEVAQKMLTDYDPTMELLQKDSSPATHDIISLPRVVALPEKFIASQNPPTARTMRLKRSKLRLKSQEPYNRYQCKNHLPSSITDEAMIYGQAWACGFRKLSPQQKLFAKKAIDEILILGQLKALKLNTVTISQNLLGETSDDG